jgi:hypothetical protein
MKTQSSFGLQMALYVAIAGCAAAPPAPGALRVPADQSLIKALHATGVQIYQCQPSKNDPSQFEWSFKAPEASLSTKGGGKVGKHYMGSHRWQPRDRRGDRKQPEHEAKLHRAAAVAG